MYGYHEHNCTLLTVSCKQCLPCFCQNVKTQYFWTKSRNTVPTAKDYQLTASTLKKTKLIHYLTVLKILDFVLSNEHTIHWKIPSSNPSNQQNYSYTTALQLLSAAEKIIRRYKLNNLYSTCKSEKHISKVLSITNM